MGTASGGAVDAARTATRHLTGLVHAVSLSPDNTCPIATATPHSAALQESDTPNFTGSYYSHCKAMVENLLKVRSRGCCSLRATRGAWGRGSDGCMLVLGLWTWGGQPQTAAPWRSTSQHPPAALRAPPRAGVPQRADPARAHAHCGRPSLPPQLHHQDHQVRGRGGAAAQCPWGGGRQLVGRRAGAALPGSAHGAAGSGHARRPRWSWCRARPRAPCLLALTLAASALPPGMTRWWTSPTP